MKWKHCICSVEKRWLAILFWKYLIDRNRWRWSPAQKSIKCWKKLFSINSLQIQQNNSDGTDGWFYDTFLQILFNREVEDFDWHKHSAVLSIAKSIDQSYKNKSACHECGKKGLDMIKCADCKSVSYCDEVCARRNWMNHVLECWNNTDDDDDDNDEDDDGLLAIIFECFC